MKHPYPEIAEGAYVHSVWCYDRPAGGARGGVCIGQIHNYASRWRCVWGDMRDTMLDDEDRAIADRLVETFITTLNIAKRLTS